MGWKGPTSAIAACPVLTGNDPRSTSTRQFNATFAIGETAPGGKACRRPNRIISRTARVRTPTHGGVGPAHLRALRSRSATAASRRLPGGRTVRRNAGCMDEGRKGHAVLPAATNARSRPVRVFQHFYVASAATSAVSSPARFADPPRPRASTSRAGRSVVRQVGDLPPVGDTVRVRRSLGPGAAEPPQAWRQPFVGVDPAIARAARTLVNRHKNAAAFA
ncbi:hypothetical protein DFR50_11480 [Roseiarcus fermentans]|uniref:Uncharacterized protein n=1 Tax=Roseiarcus fermentans TaxID=1473586 RepID=A0A366FC81_9HYPH|nr:hypothetical protein DFR50_11480 [Roseiarcus fermentans]